MQINQAAENFCFKNGHNFKTFDEGKPFGEPTTKIIVVEKATRCSQCGMTPEHVFRYGLKLKGKGKPHASSNREASAGAGQNPAD